MSVVSCVASYIVNSACVVVTVSMCSVHYNYVGITPRMDHDMCEI